MQKSQVDYMEEVKQIKEKQEEMWSNNNRFQSQFRQEQERVVCEIQEVKKSQISQTFVNNKRLETEKNLQQAVERQGRDITNIEKGRPMFYGCLKSDYGASTSSQADPQEPVLLRTAPPIFGFQPPHPPPN
ncbi:hypothetical protein PIB30_060985 [Stylosanthes scabra]|uniref:Uncharacterized protein n=1 Tax=Stylosanthes scabra TaxID=79078 RepID=A0ABU6VN48_9FABA|nr:hypothetical protein [Stylosanthes scabra]